MPLYSSIVGTASIFPTELQNVPVSGSFHVESSNLRPFHIPNRQKMLETREMVDVTHVFPGNSGWTGDDVRAQASPVKACFFFLLVE